MLMVGMLVMMIMMRMGRTMMMITIPKQPGTCQIDRQAYDRNDNGLIEIDGDGGGEAKQAFPSDQQRNERQNDCAGEPRQISQFACAKGEAAILGMATGERIGERRYQQGSSMGRHVPTIGNQSHGAVDTAGDDLGDHHGRGQGDNHPSAALVSRMLGA
jgi:hypothetical protein